MAKRTEHLFQFSGRDIATACAAEKRYHEQRLEHWQTRKVEALATVGETIGVELQEHPITGGSQVRAVVSYGDPAAWQELELSHHKIAMHRNEAGRFRSHEKVYETQPTRNYELDAEDVHHFRLGEEGRED